MNEKKSIKGKVISLFILSIFSLILSSYLVTLIDFYVFSKQFTLDNKLPNFITGIGLLFQGGIYIKLFGIFLLVTISTSIMFILNTGKRNGYTTELEYITKDISIPKANGEGQYGSSYFTRDLDKNYKSVVLKNDELTKYLEENKRVPVDVFEKRKFESGGILLGLDTKNKKGDKIYYVDDDQHSIILGSTGSGKSRSFILQSICLQALAGECIVCSDPKAELYLYTKDFLENLGYEVITLDFDEPQKSTCYNFLQPVIDKVNENNIPGACNEVETIVKMLVGENKGEPIWQNGESSVLAFAILIVVMENKNRPELQNLANVYYFLSIMCKFEGDKDIPLNSYLNLLDDRHPAKVKAGISEVAPGRTRGSFFTSAMATLNIFTNDYIQYMTSSTEFNNDFKGKRAIFMILPSHDTKYYKIASLFVSQYYNRLVVGATQNGNRLPRRYNFNLDEFGNFTKIDGMTAKITVARGYGIRFNLVLQAYKQLDSVYGKDQSNIIKGNCKVLVYLLTDDEESIKEVSSKLDNYTTSVVSKNLSSAKSGSYSSGVSLIKRPLLTTSDIKQLQRPDTLIIKDRKNSIFYCPDLTKYRFNKILGLGDIEYNKKVITERQKSRKEISNEEISKLNQFIDIQILIKETNQRSEKNKKIMAEVFKDGMEFTD